MGDREKVECREFFERDVFQGDLVLISGKSRNTRMKIGVVCGKSIRFDDMGWCGVNSTKIYLIENPTIKEIELRNKILKKIKETKQYG